MTRKRIDKSHLFGVSDEAAPTRSWSSLCNLRQTIWAKYAVTTNP
jgi:hypothetical protein